MFLLCMKANFWLCLKIQNWFTLNQNFHFNLIINLICEKLTNSNFFVDPKYLFFSVVRPIFCLSVCCNSVVFKSDCPWGMDSRNREACCQFVWHHFVKSTLAAHWMAGGDQRLCWSPDMHLWSWRIGAFHICFKRLTCFYT